MPPDDENTEEAQSRWPPDDEYLEEARSPRVDLADVVARLQKEVEEFRAESGYGGSRRSAIPPRAGPGLRQRRYPCVRERLVGTNIGKCLRLLLVRMGGTVSRRLYSLCLISKGTPSTWPY